MVKRQIDLQGDSIVSRQLHLHHTDYSYHWIGVASAVYHQIELNECHLQSLWYEEKHTDGQRRGIHSGDVQLNCRTRFRF